MVSYKILFSNITIKVNSGGRTLKEEDKIKYLCPICLREYSTEQGCDYHYHTKHNFLPYTASMLSYPAENLKLIKVSWNSPYFYRKICQRISWFSKLEQENEGRSIPEVTAFWSGPIFEQIICYLLFGKYNHCLGFVAFCKKWNDPKFCKLIDIFTLVRKEGYGKKLLAFASNDLKIPISEFYFLTKITPALKNLLKKIELKSVKIVHNNKTWVEEL